MTYKNLIFNNTNQFKNHQRHKNSFAGAYQEGGQRRGRPDKVSFHFAFRYHCAKGNKNETFTLRKRNGDADGDGRREMETGDEDEEGAGQPDNVER